MPSCVFNGESAKLDAEQRQRQIEEEAKKSREFEEGTDRVANGDGTRSLSTSIKSLYSDESRNEVTFCHNQSTITSG